MINGALNSILDNFNFIDNTEFEKQEMKNKQKRINLAIKNVNIPKKYLRQAEMYKDSFLTKESILFYGKTGTGKTTLAVNLCLQLIINGCKIYYISEPDLEVIDNFNKEKIEAFIEKEVLFIDDLGILSNSDKFLLKKIKVILLKRLELKKQTIITTNYNLKELLGENISDKIREDFLTRKVDINKRKNKGELK